MKASPHALLAGNTDEIQVVDGGLGASIKREEEEVFDEWLEVEANYTEWSSARLSASRRRVLISQWYGEAYDRVCKTFNYTKVFDKTGSSLTIDGSDDDLIKIQGLDTFTFNQADEHRCPKTGLLPAAGGETGTNNHSDSADSEDNSDEEFEIEAPAGSGTR